MKKQRSTKIGLALGSGSARGWAHIGVLRTLEQNGIVPDIVCGTSIGALVGAAAVMNELARLESWVRTLSWQGVVSQLDLTMSGGLIKGEKLFEFFRSKARDRDIRDLSRCFGAVATDLGDGREVWLRSGSVLNAVRASISLPGLFSPYDGGDHLLVDGALVNPVPVSMCRELGADIVIAVDLNTDLLNKRQIEFGIGNGETADTDSDPKSLMERLTSKLADTLSFNKDERTPSVIDVVLASIDIMQIQISRTRLEIDPADITVKPKLSHFALLDFHRADEAIKEGERAATEVLPEIKQIL